jgi:hypothetical protein
MAANCSPANDTTTKQIGKQTAKISMAKNHRFIPNRIGKLLRTLQFPPPFFPRLNRQRNRDFPHSLLNERTYFPAMSHDNTSALPATSIYLRHAEEQWWWSESEHGCPGARTPALSNPTSRH